MKAKTRERLMDSIETLRDWWWVFAFYGLLGALLGW